MVFQGDVERVVRVVDGVGHFIVISACGIAVRRRRWRSIVQQSDFVRRPLLIRSDEAIAGAQLLRSAPAFTGGACRSFATFDINEGEFSISSALEFSIHSGFRQFDLQSLKRQSLSPQLLNL
jgi:hypothetical protein